jgi:hypothetical protein
MSGEVIAREIKMQLFSTNVIFYFTKADKNIELLEIIIYDFKELQDDKKFYPKAKNSVPNF